jgi:hypothetical protein
MKPSTTNRPDYASAISVPKGAVFQGFCGAREVRWRPRLGSIFWAVNDRKLRALERVLVVWWVSGGFFRCSALQWQPDSFAAIGRHGDRLSACV